MPDGIQGDRYIVVLTDWRDEVNEGSHEDDNASTGEPLTVVLSPWADLQVRQVSAPAQGFSGEPLDVTWYVQNYGQGATRESEKKWNDRIYLSADDTLSGDDFYLGYESHTGELTAGAEYEDTDTVGRFYDSRPAVAARGC